MTDELNNPVDQPNQTPDSGEVAVPGEQVGDRPVAGPEGAAPGDEGLLPGAESPSPESNVASEEAVARISESPAEAVAAESADVAEAEATEAGEAAVPAAPPEKAARSAGKKSAKKAEVKAEPQGPKSENMQWYILKVQSNREESIREGLLRRIAIAGLDFFVGDVIVPVEKVTEFKGGKRRVTKRKLYPGYLVVQMEINEDTWFVVRETPGIGDFTGASGHPTTMQPHEVARILAKKDEKTDEQPKLDIKFHAGDRVKINEGTFENFEGEVDSIDQTNGRVTVMINIFGRSTPVELEYWQIESI